MYATETPNFCTSTTTATIPEANGVTLVLWDIESKNLIGWGIFDRFLTLTRILLYKDKIKTKNKT